MVTYSYIHLADLRDMAGKCCLASVQHLSVWILTAVLLLIRVSPSSPNSQ